MTTFLFLVLIGLSVAGIGVFMLWRRNKLKKECTAQTAGTVIRTYVKKKKKNKSGGTRYMEYKYSVNSVEYIKNDRIGISDRGVGDSVTVFYDPSNPERSYALEGGSNLLNAIIVIGLGCITIVFAFVDLMK